MSTLAQRRAVCVLGFGRSGTSLTMQTLKTLGVALGADDQLLQPHEADNARGYWEPRWMVELNDELLAALGTTWWQPFPGEPGWEQSPSLAPLRSRARALYAERLGQLPLAGFKDPRTTLTLPFWQTIVPDLRYVVCIRNPVDAIASIQRRPEPTLPTRTWGELWLEYTARALQATAGRPRALVFYDDFFRHGAKPVTQLAHLLGVPPDDPRVAAAQALAEADLRHHRTSPVELAAAPGLSAPVRTAFLALRAAQELRRVAPGDDEATRVGDAIDRVVVDAWQASHEANATRRRVEEMETAARNGAEPYAAARWRIARPLRLLKRR